MWTTKYICTSCLHTPHYIAPPLSPPSSLLSLQVVYQNILKLSYIDKLLDQVQLAFRDRYKNELAIGPYCKMNFSEEFKVRIACSWYMCTATVEGTFLPLLRGVLLGYNTPVVQLMGGGGGGGGRDRGREEGREGGRERLREGGREEQREGGIEGGREGRREGGRDVGVPHTVTLTLCLLLVCLAEAATGSGE